MLVITAAFGLDDIRAGVPARRALVGAGTTVFGEAVLVVFLQNQ